MNNETLCLARFTVTVWGKHMHYFHIMKRFYLFEWGKHHFPYLNYICRLFSQTFHCFTCQKKTAFNNRQHSASVNGQSSRWYIIYDTSMIRACDVQRDVMWSSLSVLVQYTPECVCIMKWDHQNNVRQAGKVNNGKYINKCILGTTDIAII